MNLGQEIKLATWCNAFSFVSESFTVHFKDIWPLVSASLFSLLQILRLKHLQKHSELCLRWKMHRTASKSTSPSNEIVFFPFFNSFPDFRISFNIFLGLASSTVERKTGSLCNFLSCNYLCITILSLDYS